MLRDAGILDMPLVERTHWMAAELGRRFCAERGLESFATIERAHTLIGRLVAGEFKQRIEALEREVRRLEATK